LSASYSELVTARSFLSGEIIRQGYLRKASQSEISTRTESRIWPWQTAARVVLSQSCSAMQMVPSRRMCSTRLPTTQARLQSATSMETTTQTLEWQFLVVAPLLCC